MCIRRRIVSTIFVSALLGYPDVSAAQLVLYDNFSSRLIDPTKWFGQESTGGASSPTTEAERLIQSRQLRLVLRQYGRDDSNVGYSNGVISLNMVNPSPITTMQATVNVRKAQVDSCETNTSNPLIRARAQIVGVFFNDGTSTGPGDRTGDMQAGIQMTLNLNGAVGNVFEAFADRCTNATCSTVTFLPTYPIFDTRWATGRAFTLSVAWDQANHQFIFTATRGRVTETHTIPYTESDTTSAVAPNRQLRVYNSAVNCDGLQPQAFMEALFDNVMVNP